MHLANDMIFGAVNSNGIGLSVHALPSNQSIMTCLANDIGYDHVFSYQLGRLAIAGDALIIFSGSGNSKNIIEAAQKARAQGVKIVGFVGFDGGDLLSLCDIAVHVPINDMQIVEDLHMMMGHWLIRRIKAAT